MKIIYPKEVCDNKANVEKSIDSLDKELALEISANRESRNVKSQELILKINLIERGLLFSK